MSLGNHLWITSPSSVDSQSPIYLSRLRYLTGEYLLMHECQFCSNWIPSYIKSTQPVFEIFKIDRRRIQLKDKCSRYLKPKLFRPILFLSDIYGSSRKCSLIISIDIILSVEIPGGKHNGLTNSWKHLSQVSSQILVSVWIFHVCFSFNVCIDKIQ